PGGIRLGSRCTEIMARSARIIGIGGAIPTSSRRFSFLDRSEKGLLDYGIAWSIWGDPADRRTGSLPCRDLPGESCVVAGGEWRVASGGWKQKSGQWSANAKRDLLPFAFCLLPSMCPVASESAWFKSRSQLRGG